MPARRRSWRYQPVSTEYRHSDGMVETTVSLCEVHFDLDGRLVAWTENPMMMALGNDAEDLLGTLDRMREAVRRWRIVPHAGLTVGMAFEENEGV